MGRYSGKRCRLTTMMVLTSGFFLAEIITGYTTHSVALIADSFHMLSDIISLIVGFVAVKMSSKTTPKNTYGWQRAEVVGAMVNSVFLMALCFTIVIEAVQRFVVLEEINDPELVLIVGGIGLLVNVAGLLLFSSHGMSHSHGGGGHGHSHRGGGHSHSKKTEHNDHKRHHLTKKRSDLEIVIQEESEENDTDSYVRLVTEIEAELDKETEHKEEQISSSAQLNMKGVFLHVLGDALGSVVVIISALVIKFAHDDWRFYVDPALSLIIVFIVVSTAIPLFKQSSLILLQSLPRDVNIFDIKSKLMRKVGGIENIHEFHVWQLSGDKIIATAHIRFHNIQDYMQVAKDIKSLLHEEGIHSTTIQPEFSDDMTDSPTNKLSKCMLMCQPGNCQPMTCCGIKEKKSTKTTSSSEEDWTPTCQIATQTVDLDLDNEGNSKLQGIDDDL